MKHGIVQNLKTRIVAGSILSLCMFVFTLNSSPVMAEVYKWTDENGVTHFSQMPPPDGQEAERQDFPDHQLETTENMPANEDSDNADPEALSAADQYRQELAASRKKNAEERAANESLCQNIELRLSQIEPSRRVFYTNESGETIRMDDEERVAEVARLKELQSTLCQ